MRFDHGGDVYSAENEGLTDFSANINPLGLPENVKQAFARAAEACVHYPDPYCRALRVKIAGAENVGPGDVFCGAGASEIFYRLAWALRPKTALVAAPTFSEYRRAVESTGGEVRACPLREEEGFAAGEAFLEALGAPAKAEMAFLCNPNNPTGGVAACGFVEKAAQRCAAAGALLVVDECFMDFAPEGGAGYSAKPLLGRYPNLVVVRAYTKIFAMPGVRLGYCLTHNPALIEKLERCGPPWSVSAFAQAAGIAAAEEAGFVARSRGFVEKEREYLSEALRSLGLRVFGSAANFLLLRAPGITDLPERLRGEGILVRGCAGFEGLGPEYIRVAVRTHEENAALLRAVEKAACRGKGAV